MKKRNYTESNIPNQVSYLINELHSSSDIYIKENYKLRLIDIKEAIYEALEKADADQLKHFLNPKVK